MFPSLRHKPGRGIGGTTASRQAARRVGQASGGRFSKITEDVRNYAAEQAISEEKPLRHCTKEKSKESVESGPDVYAKARALADRSMI